MQNHMRVLEIAPENRSALLMGLEYLIGISYVDDTEVFKVGLLNYIFVKTTVKGHIMISGD
jgi:hypothetical protein